MRSLYSLPARPQPVGYTPHTVDFILKQLKNPTYARQTPLLTY
jgi:hypothetical protein